MSGFVIGCGEGFGNFFRKISDAAEAVGLDRKVAVKRFAFGLRLPAPEDIAFCAVKIGNDGHRVGNLRFQFLTGQRLVSVVKTQPGIRIDRLFAKLTGAFKILFYVRRHVKDRAWVIIKNVNAGDVEIDVGIDEFPKRAIERMRSVDLIRIFSGDSQIIAAEGLRAVKTGRQIGQGFLSPLARQPKPLRPFGEIGFLKFFDRRRTTRFFCGGIGEGFLDVLLKREFDIVNENARFVRDDVWFIGNQANILPKDLFKKFGHVPRIGCDMAIALRVGADVAFLFSRVIGEIAE